MLTKVTDLEASFSFLLPLKSAAVFLIVEFLFPAKIAGSVIKLLKLKDFLSSGKPVTFSRSATGTPSLVMV